MNPELVEIKKALKTDPKNSFLLKRLGRLYLDSGYYKQAREEYSMAMMFNPRLTSEIELDHEAVLERQPKNRETRLSLASLCLAAGEIDQAIMEFEEILEHDPKNQDIYNILGKIHIKLGQTDQAQVLLEKALSFGIKNLAISEMLAGVYLEKQEFEKAVKFYEELPPGKNNLRTLGELYARLKQYDQAAEKFSAMFSEDPEVTSEVIKKLEELLMKDERSIRIREILADIYTRTLKPELAVDRLLEIVKLAPANLNDTVEKLKRMLKNYPNHPRVGLALAEAEIQQGNFTEAIELYQTLVKSRPEINLNAISGARDIISKYPQQFLARQFLAEAYIKEGDLKAALNELRAILSFYKDGADWVITKCKELSKKEPLAREVLGYAYLSKGDFSHATLEAEALLALSRQTPTPHLLLGNIYLEQKMCRKAQEAFERALATDPYDQEIHKKYKEAKEREIELEVEASKKRLTEDEWKMSLHFDLAKLYYQLENFEDALRELQFALKDTVRAPFVYQLMSNLHREEGRFDLAISCIKKGLAAAPPDQIDFIKKMKYSLALSLEAQGQIKKALNELEDIHQEDMDFPGLTEKIKFLKNSSLSSIQNKLLAAVCRNFESGIVIGFWGREAKRSSQRPTLSVSFGQNYNQSGWDCFNQGMFEAAQEEFALAVQLDPHYAVGLNNLGVSLLVNKKFEEAIPRLRAAFEMDPASPVIASNLGLAYGLAGQLQEAVKWLEKAAAVDKEFSGAHLNLGDVLYASKQVKKSVEELSKIADQDILANLKARRLLYKSVIS
jgi:tetratricopeptide (TPR) repeat protein